MGAAGLGAWAEGAEPQTGGAIAGKSDAAISLPSGGGGIHGLGEKFKPDLFTGTGNYTVPLPLAQARSVGAPELKLQYSSGNGNGPFGLGWQLSLPRIARKTDRGVPRYDDSDVFVLSGAEDLVPARDEDSGAILTSRRRGHTVTRYRPRIEGAFSRVERWVADGGETHWRITTRQNVTSVFGRTAAARVADPLDAARVFEWFLEETFDPRGNHQLLEYARDELSDSDREVPRRREPFVQLYLRSILYGNAPDSLAADRRTGPGRLGSDVADPWVTRERHYLFQVLFDYGDLPATTQLDGQFAGMERAPALSWPLREDAFSSMRAGFEIRTRFLCRRILALTHVPEGALAGAPLVRSVELRHGRDPHGGSALLEALRVYGHQREESAGGPRWESAAMPALRFEYTAFDPGAQRHRAIVADSGTGSLPSLRDRSVALLDVYGDGLPDVVGTGAGTAALWNNLGEGRFARRELPTFPADVKLGDPGVSVGDLGGDGLPDLIVLRGAQRGFYEAMGDGRWKPFRPFRRVPTFSPDDPEVRWIDLTGDGRPDALRTDDRGFSWFPCLGEDGWGEPEFRPRLHDLDAFPDVFLSDPRVRIADMNGDGLDDLVLVQSGRIDYWPSKGHGRFGRRVTMHGVPRFAPEVDPARVLLVDVDGTGCADLVVLGRDRVELWFNRCGSGFGQRFTIYGTPRIDSATDVRVTDVFGSGTATLIWSREPEPGRARNLDALELCGGVKPCLLAGIQNGLGEATNIRWGRSTDHALRDRKEGRRWVTTLPFPVHVVDGVDVVDEITGNKLATRYMYHDGWFDGRDREFRGFACVEQVDTEQIEVFAAASAIGSEMPIRNAARWSHVPPVRTVTWFHTGFWFDDAFPRADGVPYGAGDLAAVARRRWWAGDPARLEVSDPVVPTGADPREAYRALKGTILRTEVYADDGAPEAVHPYLVTENRYEVLRTPVVGDGTRPVHFALRREAITSHYERNPADPRIVQELVLAHDAFGNPLEAVKIAYPRRPSLAAHDEQRSAIGTYTLQAFVNQPDDERAHWMGQACELLRYELHGIPWRWPADGRAHALATEALAPVRGRTNARDPVDAPVPGSAAFEKRLIEWSRAFWRTDVEPDAVDPIGQVGHRLPFGVIEPLGLPYQTYRAVFSPKLLDTVYGERLDGLDGLRRGGYHPADATPDPELGAPGWWWIATPRYAFDPAAFHQVSATQDVFGQLSRVKRDVYALLPVESTDPIGNTVRGQNDYHTLQPFEVTDPNGQVSSVAYDALGMVVATAARSSTGEGDALNGVVVNLGADVVAAHLADPLARAAELLGGATSRTVHDVLRFEREGRPACACTITRTQHASDAAVVSAARLQLTVVHLDGSGHPLQTKQLDGEPDVVRWIASGTVVVNNKGQTIQQYEPFFSPSPAFGLEQRGATSTAFYDPLGRPVCTMVPGRRAGDRRCWRYEKVRFGPWRQETWDPVDTVLLDPRTDVDVSARTSAYVAELERNGGFATWYELRAPPPPGDSTLTAEQEAARESARHAGSYTEVHLDVLGRPFLTIQHCPEDPGIDGNAVRVALDIRGNQLRVTDARGVVAVRNAFDLASRVIRSDLTDAGTRTVLPDAAEAPLESWDPEGHRSSMHYDALRRPTELWVDANGTRVLAIRTAYGEVPQAAGANARGRAWRIDDQTGRVEYGYDWKGNVASSVRTLAPFRHESLDWSASRDLLADGETFRTLTAYDAGGRPTAMTDPGGTRHLFGYDRRGLLRTASVEPPRAAEAIPFVTAVTYNAKGQRQGITYASGVSTNYSYDEDTSVLVGVVTRRDTAVLQDLRYIQDAVGHVTRIEDAAFHSVFNRNQEIAAASTYSYDALSRLTSATGREHEALDACRSSEDGAVVVMKRQPVQDGRALRNFSETYSYDRAGNLLEIRHRAARGNWTRTQTFSDAGNRLVASDAGCAGEPGFTFEYDARGNVRTMPHLRELVWDPVGDLRTVALATNSNGPMADRVWYVQDGSGQRVRKVLERGGEIRAEWIYLGPFELFRRRKGERTTLERRTIHVLDDARRVALVETSVEPQEASGMIETTRIRYQHENHLGSSVLETDEQGATVTYEEHTPWGRLAYTGAASISEATRRRYRYLGHERDEETGFYRIGSRDYAPWLGRWVSPDPAGVGDGLATYAYARNNPISMTDPSGRKAEDTPAATPLLEVGLSGTSVTLLPESATPIQIGGGVTAQTYVSAGEGQPSERSDNTTAKVAVGALLVAVGAIMLVTGAWAIAGVVVALQAAGGTATIGIGYTALCAGMAVAASAPVMGVGIAALATKDPVQQQHLEQAGTMLATFASPPALAAAVAAGTVSGFADPDHAGEWMSEAADIASRAEFAFALGKSATTVARLELRFAGRLAGSRYRGQSYAHGSVLRAVRSAHGFANPTRAPVVELGGNLVKLEATHGFVPQRLLKGSATLRMWVNRPEFYVFLPPHLHNLTDAVAAGMPARGGPVTPMTNFLGLRFFAGMPPWMQDLALGTGSLARAELVDGD